MKIKLDKLLKNKMVLYITFFLALVSIFGYLVKQNYPAILFFTLVLFLTKNFSSNMIVILGISILATNLLDVFRIFSFRNIENFEGKEPSPEVKKILEFILNNYITEEVTLDELMDKDKNATTINKINNHPELEKKMKEASEKLDKLNITIDNYKNTLSISDLDYLLHLLTFYKEIYEGELKKNPESKKLNDLIVVVNKAIEFINKIKKQKNLEIELQKERKKNSKEPVKENTDLKNNDKQEIKCSNDDPDCNKKKTTIPKKEAMSGLAPAEVNSNNAGSGNVPNFDDAKMKENAFDNLEKIFGSDNVRSMTSETNDVSRRQNVIMSQLKDVGPLMQQAMNLIKNVDMDAINSISNKMTGMIGNLQQLKDENNN